MADTLMPTPEPHASRGSPPAGGFDELLARLLQRAPAPRAAAIGPIAVAPPGDPEEAEDVIEDDLDDDDDDIDEDDDVEDDDDDDFDDDEDDDVEVEEEEKA